MLKVLQRVEWEKKITETRPIKLNEQLEVVNSLCDIFKYTPVHFIYERKGKCVISFLALTKNKTVYAPIHFFYSSLWIDEGLSDLKFMEYVSGFVNELKLMYDHINIRLSPNYLDLRPFLWNDFSIINNYTYIKSLESLHYQATVRRNLEKLKNIDFCFGHEELTDESMEMNLKIFEELHLPSSKAMKIKKLMQAMALNGYLKCFNCYLDSLMVASMQVFLDEVNKVAYLILLSQTNAHQKLNVHSASHHFLFSTLKEKGYLLVDLMGGDFKGISAFKSSLNATLVPHFTLNYSKRKSIFKKIKRKQITMLKKILARFYAI